MEFQRIILVHYHEIGLKGRNRSVFEKRLQKNLEALLCAFPIVTIHRISGRLLVFLREGTVLEVANACADAILGVPGVARVSCGFKCEQDMEPMGQAACIALAEAEPFESFKVSARRNHTTFPIDSMQLNRDIGAVLCEAFPAKRVKWWRVPPTCTPAASAASAGCLWAVPVPWWGFCPRASTRPWRCGAWPGAARCAWVCTSRGGRRPPTPRSSSWTISPGCWSARAVSHACTWYPSATTSVRSPLRARRGCASSCIGASCSAWPRRLPAASGPGRPGQHTRHRRGGGDAGAAPAHRL